ncbi:MAG TPA: GAK system CofD-like protein, partial [Polyangiaceae bacterium]|nr:GAK system CofD-like protein [Polyangiaceae bacterium]
MAPSPQITRAVLVPDELRVMRSSRAPEFGPRILFLSGGTALRPLCRVLKQYTHNSVHLITAFDSGGSSAQLRHAFAMPAIGDLRNRIVALADESVRGNPQIYRLFCYRLPAASPVALRTELDALVSGEHPFVSEIVEPMRRIVQTHLRFFVERMPSDFDLRGANIGNLLLAGGFLSHSRDLESALFLFSKLLEVRGVVRPIVDGDLHLCADLADDTRVVGQHRLTGKEVDPIRSPVRALSLVQSLADPTPASIGIGEKVQQHIEEADLICYPMGSFYSSVLANLLPRGVSRSIAAAGCPRVYIPNTGNDPEQRGMSVADGVETLLRHARADAGADLPLSRVVNLVLLDRDPRNYSMPVDVDRLERLGVQVLELDLVTESSRPYVHPQRLTE